MEQKEKVCVSLCAVCVVFVVYVIYWVLDDIDELCMKWMSLILLVFYVILCDAATLTELRESGDLHIKQATLKIMMPL